MKDSMSPEISSNEVEGVLLPSEKALIEGSHRDRPISAEEYAEGASKADKEETDQINSIHAGERE